MAAGNFDGEIKDAMQSKSRMKPSGGKSATPSSPGRPTSRGASPGRPPPGKQSASRPPSFPPKQQAGVPPQQPHMPIAQAPQPAQLPMQPMQPAGDPIGHAAGIAHAILAHGKGGMM